MFDLSKVLIFCCFYKDYRKQFKILYSKLNENSQIINHEEIVNSLSKRFPYNK